MCKAKATHLIGSGRDVPTTSRFFTHLTTELSKAGSLRSIFLHVPDSSDLHGMRTPT